MTGHRGDAVGGGARQGESRTPPAAVVEIRPGTGSKAPLQALEEGKIDIALASHGLVGEELRQRGMAVHEIATVAVVFGVNASVPVANLTGCPGL